MVNMDTKLDTWKNKLLDMGKRNRLLNYRDTRRSNLRIKLPGIYDLWESFVVNEHPLEFPFVDEEQQLSLEEESGDFIAAAGSVQTNQSIKEQQRTLRNLRSKAKTFMEEQASMSFACPLVFCDGQNQIIPRSILMLRSFWSQFR